MVVTQHCVFEAVLSDQIVHFFTRAPGQCEVEKRREFEVILKSLHYKTSQGKVGARCMCIGPSYQWGAPRDSVWDELQQKECRSVSRFYKKVSKFLKLENSKEMLHKAQEATTCKKKDQGDKVEQKNGNDNGKAEEKQRKSPKKPRSGLAKNKAPLPKYTNYHALNASLDHISVMTDKNLYRKPDVIKSDRSRRDVRKNCASHKDIEHNT